MGNNEESNRIFSSTYNFNILKYRYLDADLQVVVNYKVKLVKPVNWFSYKNLIANGSFNYSKFTIVTYSGNF
jgi:hypothetical protein